LRLPQQSVDESLRPTRQSDETVACGRVTEFFSGLATLPDKNGKETKSSLVAKKDFEAYILLRIGDLLKIGVGQEDPITYKNWSGVTPM
jgi:hypothetical protein